MKRTFIKGSIWLLMTVALAAVAFAATQQLPDGDGKKLVEDRCASCHGLDLITDKKQNKDAWKTLVERMVGYGAQLNTKEAETTVDYLAKSFAQAGAAPAPAPAASDDAAAKKLTEDACSSCHDFEQVKAIRQAKDGWMELVTRMNNRGAGLSEKDTETVVNYLTKAYGPK